MRLLLVFHSDMMCTFQAVANTLFKSSPFFFMSAYLPLCPDYCKRIAYFVLNVENASFSRCCKESVSHIKKMTE